MKNTLINLVIIIFASLVLSVAEVSANNIRFSSKYFVLSDNNSIKIYKTNDLDNIYMNIDLDVSTLPKMDQDELNKGIFLKNNKSLREFIEDYTS